MAAVSYCENNNNFAMYGQGVTSPSFFCDHGMCRDETKRLQGFGRVFHCGKRSVFPEACFVGGGHDVFCIMEHLFRDAKVVLLWRTGRNAFGFLVGVSTTTVGS